MNNWNRRAMRYIVCSISLFWAPFAIAGDYYDEMKSYFSEVFAGEVFVPVPYGADSRFSPGSYWVEVDNLQKYHDRNRTKRGWIFASSGAFVFSENLVRVVSNKITLPTVTDSKKRKAALALAVANVTPVVEELLFDADSLTGMTLEISFGESHIEYLPYAEAKLAQQQNAPRLALLKDSFSELGNVSATRVIIGAIKVRGAKIEARFDASISADLKIRLIAALTNLGFTFESNQQQSAVLELIDWQYIGYQAMTTDSDLKISSAVNPQANLIEMSPVDVISSFEQLSYSAPSGN